jgi:F-type H+-transporting ATPase subunit b
VELSWSTFVLELVNFLVLIWILKRFLYGPILDIIARRRAKIEQELADAAKMQADAAELQKRYEGRLADWDRERQAARDKLAGEFEDERSRRLKELAVSLEQEREKQRVADERRKADVLRGFEATALQHGSRFAARLLRGAAGPDVESRLVELLLSDLAKLPLERADGRRISFAQASAPIAVTSAYALPAEQRERLESALGEITDSQSTVSYSENPDLLAGIQITIGAWVLAANLRDELVGFTEFSRDE